MSRGRSVTGTRTFVRPLRNGALINMYHNGRFSPGYISGSTTVVGTMRRRLRTLNTGIVLVYRGRFYHGTAILRETCK